MAISVQRSFLGGILLCSTILTPVYAEIPTNMKKGISPTRDQWTTLRQEPPVPTEKDEALYKDANALARFLLQSPSRLDVSKMTPVIADEVATALLQGGEPLRSVSILSKALTRWPTELVLIHGWGRAMVTLGMPSYAIQHLKQAMQRSPDSGYTRYLYALCRYLEGPSEAVNLTEAIAELEELLRRQPQYRGPDGLTATQVKRFIEELQGRLASR